MGSTLLLTQIDRRRSMFVRKNSQKWITPLLLVIAMFLAACGGAAPSGGTGEETGGQTGGEVQASEAPAEAGGGAQITGACANQYYPVTEGTTRTYSATGGIEDFTYTETISGVAPDGFTVTTSYSLEGNLQTTQRWACQSDGLVALDYNGGPSAALSTEGLSVQYNTTGVTGVTVPANLGVGTAWNQTLTIEGDMVIGEGMTGHATGDVSYSANAVGTESVTTPAGTFDAIKVEIQQNFNVTADLSGVSVPVAFTGTTTTWYAPGVGMVKSIVTIDLMESTTTVELQSYTIP
jgi:hypothetical protein